MKSINIVLPDFRGDIFENGSRVRQITSLSCGMDGHRTPLFASGSIGSREKLHISGAYPPPNGGARMPYSLFFDIPGKPPTGCAFHQGDPFAASHGCIHLDVYDAEWLFEWCGDDPVTVSNSGPYPSSPVRAHTYQLGAANMLPRVIRDINTRLRELGCLVADEGQQFTAATAQAVKAFQESQHLAVDGKVGGRTAPALGVRI